MSSGKGKTGRHRSNMNARRLDMTQPAAALGRIIRLGASAYTIGEAGAIGVRELSSGRADRALAIFDLILAQIPRHAEAHNYRGVALQALNRYSDALASFDRALALNPGYADAHVNRGNVLLALRRLDDSLASFDRAVAIAPENALAHNNRAIALREMGRFADALAGFDRAVALQPNYAMAYNNRGLIQKELKRYAEAIANFDRAIAIEPDVAMTHVNRALALQEIKLFDEALVSLDRAIALKPGYAEAHSARGSVLSEQKLYDDALASCDRAIALNGSYAEAYHNRGVILVRKGAMDEAEQMFRKALALNPNAPTPLFSLTRIRKYTDPNHEDIKAIRAMLDKPFLPPTAKEFLYFALGKIYDDCGAYDKAFECYRQANLISNAAAGYDPDKTAEVTNTLKEVFSKEFLARSFAFASGSRSPLFVVGMPRSGTTLMASILSNHREIATAGELRTIWEWIRRLPELIGTETPYPRAVEHITPEAAMQVIAAYEKRLRRDVGPEIVHVIDKNPLNFRHLGFIHMLFPRARIIHCVRHPLDTGLSIYFQNFSLGNDFAFDLRNIGHFYREYLRLMEHWREVLPGMMIEVNYEDMVDNTEQVARRTLDFLGLEWDERCLAPHTNPAPIDTASNWQVRQPIYKHSVERWRNYEKHLAPLKEMLGLP
jgi:tetratricopeptide (TPR) repeat protein